MKYVLVLWAVVSGNVVIGPMVKTDYPYFYHERACLEQLEKIRRDSNGIVTGQCQPRK